MAPAHRPPRYQLGFRLASGGMATVRYGRRVAAGGFAHAVAIKELHPHLSHEPSFVAMFLDEARLAARVVHPNVVSVLDVVSEGEAVSVVMQYVEGESLARLVGSARKRADRIPVRVAVAVLLDVLAGLAAAHRATDERGQSLGIVHRDVSPQNVMVGVDGVARVLDFGIAKANGRLQETRDGQVKGKLSYMAPEQLGGDAAPTTDVYAAAIILWELLAGRRLFEAESDLELIGRVLQGAASRPSAHAEVPAAIDDVVMKALALDAPSRFASASEMSEALTLAAAGAIATRAEVAAWVEDLAADSLAERRGLAAEMANAADARSLDTPPPPSVAPPPAPDLVTSTVVMDRAHPRPRTRSRLPRLFGAAAVAIGLAAVSATAARTLTPPTSLPNRSSAGPVPAAVARAEQAALAEPAPVAPSAPATIMSTPATPTPAPNIRTHVASATPKPLRLPRGSSAALSALTPAGATTEPAPRVDESCDPPFVVDASGLRQYKRACIR